MFFRLLLNTPTFMPHYWFVIHYLFQNNNEFPICPNTYIDALF